MPNDLSNHQKKSGIRTSLACQPCRYKHLRCDARKPACSPCTADRKQCVYPHSRRRGNKSAPQSTPTLTVGNESTESRVEAPSRSVTSRSSDISGQSENADQLLALYYVFFHAAHPCVLPCQFLKLRQMEDAIQPLLLVMQYIGSIFASSIPEGQYEDKVQRALIDIQMRNCPITGFDVQAVLLYAIAIYWCNDTDRGTDIPVSRTLQQYDNREFMADEMEFSSYAELIGLTRGIDMALSSSSSNIQIYNSMCAKSDTSMAAWHSLLPSSKRSLIRPDGSLDEVMFKAQFIMHTPIESVSRCAPLAPSDNLRSSSTSECQLHTVKCLWAIDHLDQLLTLPTNITTHSPFIICMIANATIAHLAACRFVYHGEKLRIAREKIRLTMGTLKVLSEYWLLGKRTYREIGIIAREILSIT
ncbi:hypothetical protein ASPWEDRAFT_738100 [Aspergillus wentii DTO 134E9]|uniref:Zn(2)-C6 fungal-type domain-containing protein n=1 Tax=Aspergillus wentii DTO 134E9 TaxID=1073089 RepID=A0A1L9RPW9_ASPWE|nr:uncharacterized protein ASPWEDRAFT_738100 [Aspergillus wentii DTO 134E9]OJJ36979.1 hypothetical protein ASPWEDRAFT_738100 [Aspergillus wentii DTO 134E9]